MARARSGATMALMRVESRTVPRNNIRWLGDSVPLAKLTLSPRRSRRRRVLCDNSSTSDWARTSQSSRLSMRIPICLKMGKSRVHALRKSAGGHRQPKGKERVLISHSLEGKSQESSVMGSIWT